MYKKAVFIFMIVAMMVALAGFAQAARIPAPGEQFTVKAGTSFLAMLYQRQPGMIQAFEDVKVTVSKIIAGQGVMFNHNSFPHNCPYHGREPVPIQGLIKFDYFEKNPDAYIPKE